jgi:uncharacterized lipoprotein YddW (UPF0748 family)
LLGVVAAVQLLTAVPGAGAPQSPQAPAEVRAVWVDAFHAGIRSPAEVQTLVDAAVRARLNTIFVQVRRRGDVLFPGGIDPPLDDPAYDPSFDALAHVVDKGHAAGLRVHAWINAAPVWRDEAPPKAAGHVFNRHGLAAEGDAQWLTRMRDGTPKFIVGYFLDLAHPAAADYLAGVYLDVARRYKVDGIHFDYIRYPETEPPLPRGADVGYNPVSLARFGRVHGRTDLPAPDDEAWSAWRRAQVSHFVRRVSLECREVNPTLQVSAATIVWGKPPVKRTDFIDVAPMQRIFQDWIGWLEAGWLDMAVPMNYAREQNPTVRGWFDGWIAWEKRYRGDRHLVVGLGAYLNAQDDVLAQVERVRQPERRRTVNGISFFSYFLPHLAPEGQQAAPNTSMDYLATGTSSRAGAFAGPAPVPSAPWLARPEKGYLLGRALDERGVPLDTVSVSVRRRGWFQQTWRSETDGNGYFGLARLSPGRYRVRLADAPEAEVAVTAGRVSRVEVRR